jgi:hypothetical protein
MSQTCQEKLSFETKAQAAGTATTSHWRYGQKLKIYKCRSCKLWHLSSQPED